MFKSLKLAQFSSGSLSKVAKRFVSANKYLKYRMNEPLPPYRSDPIIKTLDTPAFKTILTPEVKFLQEVFKRHNYELRVAGGAVRDLLSGIIPEDLDFATTATPQQMKQMFEEEQLRTFNENGEKHGTVSTRINDKANFEITTLRIDVVTNGRHADVEFITDWLLDAARRDLTINSMFLDLEGNIYDYFYGYDDLMKRRVAFVGEPGKRIVEDFLRIFRYFRFYGRIAEFPDNHDEETIKAIKANVDGLEVVSGERIWSEWSKILVGNFNKEIVKKMLECGMGKHMGLPEEPYLEHFEEVCERAQKNGVQLKPVSFVAALLRTQEEVFYNMRKLKYSRIERRMCSFIVQHRDAKLDTEFPMKIYQKMILQTMYTEEETREYIGELLKYNGRLDLAAEIQSWNDQFPVSGNDIKNLVGDKRRIGLVIQGLKDVWIDSGCKASKDDLVKAVPNVLVDLASKVDLVSMLKEERYRRKQRRV